MDIVELQVEIPFIVPLPSPTKGPKKTKQQDAF